MLDLGTGTGVLAIAAAKALREEVLASDIDPPSRAGRAAKTPRLNGIGPSGARRSAPPASPRRSSPTAAPFDLVLANILANPLRQMATPMARHLAPSALVILSGLLHASGPGVDRRLPCARAGAGAASAHRRLEQPATAQGRLKVPYLVGRCGLRAISALLQ